MPRRDPRAAALVPPSLERDLVLEAETGSSAELASGLTGAPASWAPGNRSPDVDHEPALPRLLRKEVIQPHLPVRLPCYDFTPIADPTFDGSLHKGWATGFGCYRLSWCDGRCVQGPGTYSPQRC